jgi:radical SAM protein with 4Fe4S-binding SPASM domain
MQGLRHPNLIRLYASSNKRESDALRDFYGGKIVLPHLPTIIRIEPTNKCNLRCIMCPTGQDNDRPTGFMDLNLYKKIIDEASTFPHLTWLILYLGGEPLLHKDLPEMVKLAKSKGLYCRFNTNATLLNRDNMEALLKSGLDSIVFSFDDVSPAEYEATRRNAKYSKTLSSIIQFLELKRELNKYLPLVTVFSVTLRKNDDKPLVISQNFRELFGYYDIQNLENIYAGLWAGDFASNKLYNYEKPKLKTYKDCSMLWNNFTINWQGDVVPCCYDLKYDCILGNVRDNTIAEIWNSDKVVNMRKLIKNREYDSIKLCSNCSAVKE